MGCRDLDEWIDTESTGEEMYGAYELLAGDTLIGHELHVRRVSSTWYGGGGGALPAS
jgi:hypothetical protein